MQKCGLTSSSECSFCLSAESLLHVVAGRSSYLDRFTWRHDSILQFIANNLPSQHIQNIYADLPPFPNPSVITGDDYRPDLLILTKDNCLYILELTVGYETNLRNNINRKRLKYEKLIMDQRKKFNCVKFINLSISALGVFDNESASFLKMLEDMHLDKTHNKLHRRITFSVVEEMDETRFIEILKPVSYLYIVVDCIVMYIMCVFIIVILPNISSSQL